MDIKNLTMSFGLEEIYDDVTIHINDLEKVGVVGVNGAGKSTLFKLILRELTPDSGSISFKNGTRIGFLPQVISDEVTNMDISVFEFLLTGRPIKELQTKLEQEYYNASIETDDKKLDIIMKKISKLQDKLEYYEVYNCENILLKIVAGMNIDDNLLDMPLSSLSGGQKSKVAFAKLLYSNPEVLLLDEPTNHLDIDTKEYIINYLKKYHGTILVISHDIEFLNEVTTSTLYIDKLTHKMELFPGSYEKYLKIKGEREKTLERVAEKQVKEEEKLKRIIAKYIGGNEKKANIAKDRIKKLERLEKEKVVILKKNKYASFKMEIDHPSGIIPIKVEDLSFGYTKDNSLYNNLTFDIERGEKFLVVGPNGIGKSTLLKLIIGHLTPDKGLIKINGKVTLAYYAQEHEILENDKTILDNFKNYDLSVNKLRSFLGSFLFFGDDVYKKINVLSPGERSRVALAKIALSKSNMILLDEPTNHLDPETQKIIADIFKSYEGTMLVVSHNLEFVDNLGVERMLVLPEGKIKYYDKSVVEYFHEINNDSKK